MECKLDKTFIDDYQDKAIKYFENKINFFLIKKPIRKDRLINYLNINLLIKDFLLILVLFLWLQIVL